MKLSIYTIHDSKVGAYLKPVFMRSTGEMLRVIIDLANDPNHEFHKFAEDFSIHRIAEYDEQTGQIQPLPISESLGKILDYKKSLN